MTFPRTRSLSHALLLSAICAASASIAAQTAAPTAAAPQPMPPSSIMKPSLDSVLRTLDDLRPEKWKTSGAIRQETAGNIDSIRRDLTNTLPSLLANADRAPDSVAQTLPAYRNIDALYDVLLRVTETGRLAAPKDQAADLQQALDGLESGRHALGERMQAAAVAREQHVHTLEAAARAAAAAPKPAPPVCPTVTHTTRRRTTHKKTTKKHTTQSTTTAPTANTSH